MLKRISIFWVLLVALMITSAVPVAYIAFFEVDAANEEFKQEAIAKMRDQNRSQALIFNEQLEEFRLTTDLLARNVQRTLNDPVQSMLPPIEVERRLNKYGVQDTGFYGLDEWFETEFRPREQNELISNVFLDGGATEPTQEQAQLIAITDSLNPLMATLGDSLDASTYIGTHNIIITFADGVQRRFPYWPSNWTPEVPFVCLLDFLDPAPPEVVAEYLDDCEDYVDVEAFFNEPLPEGGSGQPGPREISAPVFWSLPEIDFDRDGKLFVINLVPMFDMQGNYIGSVAHDLDTTELTEAVVNIDVGEQGQAFIMDAEGYLMMHTGYDPTAAWQTLSEDEQEALYDDVEAQEAFFQQHVDVEVERLHPGMKSMVEDMVATLPESGFDFFDEDGEHLAVSYHLIPETDWYLVYVQPEEDLLSTAASVSDRIQRASMITIGFVLLGAVLLARRITKPVAQLSDTAREIEQNVDEETSDLLGENLTRLGNVTSVAEINNLARVFEQMVKALHLRMVELNSIYAMGQTITSNVDYDATLKAILTSIRQVVSCDAAEVIVRRGTDLIVEAWDGGESYKDTVGYTYPDGEIKSNINQKEVLFLPDVPSEASFGLETDQMDVRSLLSIPLVHNDRLLGALLMVHHAPNAFDENIKRQITKLSAQASIAIDNAIQVKEREDLLKRQITELRVAVDQKQRETQVGEISESDFFKDLQRKSRKLKKRVNPDLVDSEDTTDE